MILRNMYIYEYIYISQLKIKYYQILNKYSFFACPYNNNNNSVYYKIVPTKTFAEFGMAVYLFKTSPNNFHYSLAGGKCIHICCKLSISPSNKLTLTVQFINYGQRLGTLLAASLMD